MSALLNEDQSFQDVNGKPIVNGFIYVGEQNSDPTIIVNQIPIFSDRELESDLPNPQRTDSFGKSVNKIWVGGRFSILVQDENEVEKFSDPDAGEENLTGILSLTNVQGTNDIDAQGVPAITNYVDKQQYTLTLVNAPTGVTTLNIDNKGEITIKNKGIDILPGQLPANQIIVVVFNSIGPVFELVSGGGDELRPRQGADVASAAQPNIWAQDGSTILITGTDPITTFTDAPRIGARVTLLIEEDGVVFTNGSGITLPGGADITTAAGDRFEVYANAVNAFSGVYIRGDGTALVSSEFQDQVDVTGLATLSFTGIPANTRQVIIMFALVKASSTFNIINQIGDSGGIETSGYFSRSCRLQAASPVTVINSLVSYIIGLNNAGDAFSGDLYLNNSTGNEWTSSHAGGMQSDVVCTGGGVKALSDTLTQILISPTSGNFGSGGISLRLVI